MIDKREGVLLTFDLKVSDLVKYYSSTSPKNAYKKIKTYLESKGFENVKDSDYISFNLDKISSTEILIEFSEKEKWFPLCVQKVSISKITSTHDLTFNIKSKYIDEKFKEEKENKFNKQNEKSNISSKIEKAKNKSKESKRNIDNKSFER